MPKTMRHNELGQRAVVAYLPIGLFPFRWSLCFQLSDIAHPTHQVI